ncbi:MAG: methyltransferase domain-containing protein, partial [Oscillospiraceae bacterium]|nr:methyltransferase domain-containing protein [Oscillospiraceae bacterium]
ASCPSFRNISTRRSVFHRLALLPDPFLSLLSQMLCGFAAAFHVGSISNYFDLIFHPVSNCYIEQAEPVWRECYRILKPDGRLLSGLDNGFNFLFDDEEHENIITGSLPFNPLRNKAQKKLSLENDCGYQFSHTIEEQIGGQIKAGFRLVDLYEDTNSTGFLKEHGVPTFWATLAIKE